MRSQHLAVAQVFLPPIGGLTVYIFGNAADLRDTSKTLAFRVVRAPPAVPCRVGCGAWSCAREGAAMSFERT